MFAGDMFLPGRADDQLLLAIDDPHVAVASIFGQSVPPKIDADGYVRIVDRKKELIINAAGKNMSPANIEARIKSASPLIGQAVCIGDARPYNVALISLDPDGAAGHDPASAETRALVEQAVELANSQLSRVEQIKKFTIIPGEWQPGGDELTPTMKLKRKPIGAKYAALIEELYA